MARETGEENFTTLIGIDGWPKNSTTNYSFWTNNTTTDEMGLVANSTEDLTNIFELMLGIVGVIGNSIVCIVIILNRSLRNMTNYFLLSLAVADLLTAVFLVFNRYTLSKVSSRVPRGIEGEIYCRLWNSQLLFWVCIKASVYNLVSVTFERYHNLTSLHLPAGERRLSKFSAILTVAAAWTLAFLAEIVYVFFHQYLDGDCLFRWPNKSVAITLGILGFLATYFIPLFILTIAYCRIVYVLKKRAGTFRSQGKQKNRTAYTLFLARQRVVKVLIIVVVAYAACWSPNQFLFLAWNLGGNIEYNSVYYKFFVLLAFSNSVVNPFIYVFTYKQYRDGFVRIFCGPLMTSRRRQLSISRSNNSTS